MMRHTLLWAVLLVILMQSTHAVADTWPRFRGPNGQGISDAKTIPSQWTDADYTWKVSLPGTGLSSPVVWNDRVFVTCADAGAPMGTLLAIDANTGTVLWQKDYALPSAKMNRLNSYATSTPALTANRVYMLWCAGPQTTLIAVDHAGNMIFSKDFGSTVSSHGPAASPIVVNGAVVFTHEQRKDQVSHWIAVNGTTGDILWKTERGQGQISYSTPCVYSPSNSPAQLIFTSEMHGIAAVASNSGTVLWEAKEALNMRVVSSPVLTEKLIIASCGSGGGGKLLTAVKAPVGNGKPSIAWTATDRVTTPYVPTCLYKDGLLYSFHDQGTVACRSAVTGEIFWQEKPAGKFYGSPVWVNGRIYCITREGQCVVLQADKQYKLLGVNDLGEASDATPAVVDERMYLRTSSKLMCLD
jgi:outer membrane protein assembly factor BamB